MSVNKLVFIILIVSIYKDLQKDITKDNLYMYKIYIYNIY